MNQLQWKTSFEIGIESIDNEHHQLLIYLNNCISNLNYASGVFDEMKNYADSHFANEENLMLAIGYPELERHLREHKIFEDRIDQLHEAVMGGDNASIGLLISFLRNWFLEHILADDKNFVKYMYSTMNEAEINELVT